MLVIPQGWMPMKRRPSRPIPAFVSRFAQAFTLAVGLGVAHAAVPPKALPMTVKAATSMAQAVQDGAKIFAQDSFGTNQVWVPAGAFGSHLMSCVACHTDGGVSEGTTPSGAHLPSLVGAASDFPKFKVKKHAVEFKSKKHAVYTLERQIAHCVHAGVMGKAPGYDSPEMVDLVVYLTALSKGSTIGQQLPAVH